MNQDRNLKGLLDCEWNGDTGSLIWHWRESLQGEHPHPFHVTEDEQEEDPEEDCDDASANEYHNLHAAFIFGA